MVVGALVVSGLLLTSGPIAESADARTPYPGGTWTPPAARYGVAVDPLAFVPMDDGVPLRVQVLRPTDPASGAPARGPFPVLITQTPYSANLGVTGNLPLCDTDLPDTGLPGGFCSGQYFVRRGYIVIAADQRGTGLSGGAEWDVFGRRQGRDGANLATWAAEQLPGSSGEVGLWGCSALGISQLATAIELGRTVGTEHPVKAMVPGCISGGLYRDTYFDNGVPGMTVPLTTGEGIIAAPRFPTAVLTGTQIQLQGPEILAGGDLAYERDYWQERKWSDGGPDIVRSGIPALVYVGWGEGGHIGGLELYAELQNASAGRDPHAPMVPGQPVTGRYQLFIGNGPHSCCLGDLGVQLQWFDHWLKGRDTGLDLDTPTPMHVEELHGGRYVNAATYPFTDDYSVLRLGPGTLTAAPPPGGSDALVWAPAIDGVSARTYETAPYADGATLAGPVALSVHASSTTSNLQLTAELYDVASDGTAAAITHGSLVGSLSELDPARTWRDRHGAVTRPYARFDHDRYEDRGVIQEHVVNLAPKVWSLAPGHRFRLVLGTQWSLEQCAGSVGIGPAPYGCINTVPQLRSLAGGTTTVYRSAMLPSALDLPLLPYRSLPTARSAPTPTSGGLPVPLDWR